VTPSASPTGHALATMVDIGGGRRVYAECDGTGEPTVVLESGDESDVFQWQLVFPVIAEQTRVCRYDRLGNGSSDPASGCRELPDLLTDFAGMLRGIGEKGPFVLVGTSGGGYLMAGYSFAHPANVVGLVLAETPHAVILSQVSAEVRKEIRCDFAGNQEARDYAKVENDVWKQRRRIGNIPMTVISNDYGDFAEGQEQQTNVAGQKGWLILSPQARQVVVTSGHDVTVNEADLVNREILRVVTAARR
jgi:pimeloyl-ACP methyl ester carboxylesterase